MPLLGLGIFVVYKRSKRKRINFHAPQTHQLASLVGEKRFKYNSGLSFTIIEPFRFTYEPSP